MTSATPQPLPNHDANNISEFETLEEFAAWLEEDLARVEEEHSQFVTNRSLCGALGR